MAVQWTRAQRDAIDARRGTVLVSAAAGSGKTAVLVQRAISRLTDPENPTPADKLLVVTFTRAAAAEMRGRLEKRLYEMLRSDPGNESLRRQSILLGQANIGTVHSFCGELIREFFHVLGIPQDFSIITDKQKEQMQLEALEETLFDAFGTEGFRQLADAFSSERDDRRLQAVILRIYEYMQSHPYPDRWMGEKVGLYASPVPVGETPWGRVLLEYAAQAAAHCIRLCTEALRALKDDELLYDKMAPVFMEDIGSCKSFEEHARGGRWDSAYRAIHNIRFTTLSAPRGYKDDPLKLHAAGIRDTVKKILRGLSGQLMADEAQCREDFSEIGGILGQLREVTRSFTENYRTRKQDRNFLDYSDLEHYAIRLLTEEGGAPSAAARQLSQRFDEIMIDEYQDINEVQDKIFQSVSRDGKNLFMVGDVKQSIYGFRCAMPDIFIRCKDSFEKYDRSRDRYPSYIVLDSNFRSRREVTESVNFVFSQIMSRQTADIDYGHEEALVYGAKYPVREDCETELYILQQEKGQNAAEQEAALAAKRIRELMESGFTVQEGGTERRAEYRDFCILLRSVKRHAHVYARALKHFGVPAKSAASGGFFDAKEIGFMLSLLRVIDNPGQDVPLLAVMMSPVYGFSPDDLAQLRAGDRKISVYLSLTRAAEANKACAKLLSDIAMYRSISATLPSDVFIGYLYEHTGYTDMVLAMEGGEQRLANLHLLQKYAHDYESAGGGGTAGFVRFMDRLTENRSELEAAALSGDDDNRVAIMSIHKSKGLEFPVCIVAGCGRKLPADREEVVLHPDLGLGMKIRDNALGARYTSMPREAILLDNRRRDSAEEMRILYVAMTRAKEKLILLGSDKNPEKLLNAAAGEITASGLSDYSIRSAGSFLKWLALCALRHPDGESLRDAAGAAVTGILRENYVPWHIELVRSVPGPVQAAQEQIQNAEPDDAIYRKLSLQAAYVYPRQALQSVPTKVAASALAARHYEQEMGITLKRPAWLSAKGMTPAERGTALHNFMQYAVFSKAARDPEAELLRLVRDEFLSQYEADAVDLRHVRRFFETELGKMVLASPDVQKERRFTVEIPAREVMQDGSNPDASVVLQGAVDCTFVYEGKLHIIDFKTDRVKSAAELVLPYREQIMLYSRAMEQISDREIGGRYLYSMYRDSFVAVS